MDMRSLMHVGQTSNPLFALHPHPLPLGLRYRLEAVDVEVYTGLIPLYRQFDGPISRPGRLEPQAERGRAGQASLDRRGSRETEKMNGPSIPSTLPGRTFSPAQSCPARRIAFCRGRSRGDFRTRTGPPAARQSYPLSQRPRYSVAL